MAKVLYKKFKATIEYKLEVNEDYQPTVKDEKQNWTVVCTADPEIVKPKISVEAV